jgi:L-arabinose isomerase
MTASPQLRPAEVLPLALGVLPLGQTWQNSSPILLPQIWPLWAVLLTTHRMTVAWQMAGGVHHNRHSMSLAVALSLSLFALVMH